MRRTVIVVTTFAALAAGCAAPWENKQTGGCWVMLVGKSPSTMSATTTLLANARTIFRRAASDGAHLLGGPIGRPATAEWPLDLDFQLQGAAKSNDHRAAEQRRRRTAEAMRQFNRLLATRAPLAGSNDLLGATAIAARELRHMNAASACGSHLYLIVLDDAHQMGCGIDVYRHKLTPRRIHRALSQCPPPDLRGVTTIIANAGLDKKANLAARRERAVETFWTHEWARRTHGKQVIFDSRVHFPE